MQVSRVPGFRRLPTLVRRTRPEVILFDSWGGSYSDNPRAVSEELHRRRADLTQVWVLDEASAERVPEWVVSVSPGSLSHLRALGRAAGLVANNTMPGYYRKPSGTRFIQTWHGTPLKRLAFDVVDPRFPGADQHLRDLAREVGSWDYLISPNRFSTEIFRQAFRYQGQIIETGYPRNDLLVSADRDRVRRLVRQSLGLGGDERVVLYAPTFRDGLPFKLELGLSRLANELGADTVVLLRAHKLDASKVDLRDEPRVRDVSDVSDIRELLLAADVLITDYSSVMFDFAVTRKPMLFFTYDLARYRDRLRGFYFDFEAEAPGPLLNTTEEVIEALQNPQEVVARYRTLYERFVERFCHLEDGGSSGRVVDLLLAPPSAS